MPVVTVVCMLFLYLPSSRLGTHRGQHVEYNSPWLLVANKTSPAAQLR